MSKKQRYVSDNLGENITANHEQIYSHISILLEKRKSAHLLTNVGLKLVLNMKANKMYRLEILN